MESNKSKHCEVCPSERFNRYPTVLSERSNETIYLGLDTLSGNEVAWRSHPLVGYSIAEREKILVRAELMKILTHPNVCKTKESWTTSDDVLCSITSKSSRTLREQINSIHPAKPKLIQKYCSQILSGLSFLHSQNPPIILGLLNCGEVLVCGTDGRLQIRLILRVPETLNEQTDIFSFGICVLEMITNHALEFDPTQPATAEALELLASVTDPEIKELIVRTILPGQMRPTAQELEDYIQSSIEEPVVNGTRDVIDGSSVIHREAFISAIVVEKTDNPSVVAITIKCDFPRSKAVTDKEQGTQWLSQRKEKSIKISSYDFGKDDPFTMAMELASSLPDFKQCENCSIVQSQLAEKLSDAVMDYFEEWKKIKAQSAMTDIVKFLVSELNFKFEWAKAFVDNEITLEDLKNIKESDLEKLVPALGPRRRLMNYVKESAPQASHVSVTTLPPNVDIAQGNSVITTAEIASMPVTVIEPMEAAKRERFSSEDMIVWVQRREDDEGTKGCQSLAVSEALDPRKTCEPYEIFGASADDPMASLMAKNVQDLARCPIELHGHL